MPVSFLKPPSPPISVCISFWFVYGDESDVESGVEGGEGRIVGCVWLFVGGGGGVGFGDNGVWGVVSAKISET
jgi:hypothetical protein